MWGIIMKLGTLSVALAALTMSSTAMADTIGVWAGGGMWDHSPSGSIRYIDATSVDLENDMKLEDKRRKPTCSSRLNIRFPWYPMSGYNRPPCKAPVTIQAPTSISVVSISPAASTARSFWTTPT